ncbi:MAG: hypothetical protein IAE89_16805 [Anaerolineae bacterium]|nr:hypothetical protein [Anaerolineae bacterium]
MDWKRCKIEVAVPENAVAAVLQAMGDAGAGTIGEYSHCSFVISGIGRFTASAGANPAIGRAGEASIVPEQCIQTWCDRAQVHGVIRAIRATHPYEEPVIYIIPLADEDRV